MEFEVRGVKAHAATGHNAMDPKKETVVFIHGVGLDHTIWVLSTRYFARHDRNVVALNLPGHGRSEGKPLGTIEEMADWVIEVMDVLAIEQAALVGHSMGSLVALDAAARHPSRVRSIAMVGVSVPLSVADPLMESSATDHHDAIDMLTYWGLSRTAQLGGSPTPGMWMVGGGIRLWERAAEGLIHTDLQACNQYINGLERGTQLKCPALLLLGSRDVMTPVRFAKALRDSIPEQDTVIFEGAGHSLLSERPDPVLDQLIRIV